MPNIYAAVTLVGLMYDIVVVDFITTLELIRLVVPLGRVVHCGTAVNNTWLEAIKKKKIIKFKEVLSVYELKELKDKREIQIISKSNVIAIFKILKTNAMNLSFLTLKKRA